MWVGWFRFSFIDHRWEWSDEVQRMHGYEPGTISPTTELVLSHQHPDDRAKVAATITDMIDTRQAFSTRHRIIDAHGRVHHVVVAGDQLCDHHGEVVGTHGFYIDLDYPAEQLHEDLISSRVAEIAEHRADIEQAKGMLMLVYGIAPNAAFDLLKWLSQTHNVKLRLLAEQIVQDFPATGGTTMTPQARFDELLLSAHQRIQEL